MLAHPILCSLACWYQLLFAKFAKYFPSGTHHGTQFLFCEGFEDFSSRSQSGADSQLLEILTGLDSGLELLKGHLACNFWAVFDLFKVIECVLIKGSFGNGMTILFVVREAAQVQQAGFE